MQLATVCPRDFFRVSLGVAICEAIILVCAGTTANADVLTFDKNRTTVHFTCGFGLLSVNGRFLDVAGEVNFSDKIPTQVRVHATIQSGSLTTDHPLLDQQLKGTGFFDVASHPTIVFDGDAMRTTGIHRAELYGKITLRGVTRPLTFTVTTQPDKKGSAGAPGFFQAISRVRRSEFGMGGLRFMLDDDCDIEIVAMVERHH